MQTANQFETLTPEQTIAHVRDEFFRPARRTRQQRMSDFQTGIMMRLLTSEPAQHEAMYQGMLTEGLQQAIIVENRCRRFTLPISADVRIMMASLGQPRERGQGQGPADIVMYLSYAVYRCHLLERPALDMEILPVLIYPDGFWSEEDRCRLWDAQKLPDRSRACADRTNGLDSRVILDWLNAGAKSPAEETAHAR